MTLPDTDALLPCPIKAELLDLGPRNGMGEPDAAGSYHAFSVVERGDKSDEPQKLTFMVPAHQLPDSHEVIALRTQLADRNAALDLAVAEYGALKQERDALAKAADALADAFKGAAVFPKTSRENIWAALAALREARK